MSSDALFQLGMGPVELDATQTEDLSSLRSMRARNANFRGSAAMLHLIGRLRGNSAKALLASA